MQDSSTTINEFLNIYQTLSKFQRKIFEYLQWFSKKWRNVFPCIMQMAKALFCSESTIKRATALFHRMGWICKVKRGYQSNLYYMNEELIWIDLNDKEIFKRSENDLINDPVLVLNSNKSHLCSTKDEVHSHNEKKDRHIPEILNMRGLDISERQALINEFSEFSLVKAIEEAKWYTKKGNIIRNLGGYLYKAAKRFSIY